MKSQGDEASHRLFFSIFGELGHFLVFGFFCTKYPLGVPVGVGDLLSNRISTAPDHAWGRGALKSTALGF